MPGKFRLFFKRAFIFFTIVVALCYMLVCLVPFLQAGDYWYIAMLGLAFPILFIIVIICLVLWAIQRSRWLLLPAIALLVSWQQVSVMFGFHGSKEFSIEKGEETLRIMSWNVSRWDEANKKRRGGTSYRSMMMDLVQMQSADVLCFQEFFESFDPKRFDPNIPEIEKMGYPYHYFTPSLKNPAGVYQLGLCIFSRYPIIDSAVFLNGPGQNGEGMSYVDIQFGGQRVRVFTTHLESVRFDREDYVGLGAVGNSESMFYKLKRAYEFRSAQAEMIKTEIKKSPYPVVVCGDMNDTPNSYAYFTVKGGLQDAFLKKGSGLGRTFRFMSPTLRIDYIFADKRFRVEQYGRPDVKYSDHYPVIADLYWLERSK